MVPHNHKSDLLELTAQTHAYATRMQLLIKDILEEVRYALTEDILAPFICVESLKNPLIQISD